MRASFSQFGIHVMSSPVSIGSFEYRLYSRIAVSQIQNPMLYGLISARLCYKAGKIGVAFRFEVAVIFTIHNEFSWPISSAL